MRNCIVAMGLLLGFHVISGCGGEPAGEREPVYRVSGKITYKGQPVVAAEVTFFCQEKNMSSFARTDDQGKFRLTSYAAFDGAPAGKQIITVSKMIVSSASTADVEVSDPAYDPDKVAQIGKPGSESPKNLIPLKYADAKTTDLFATVTPDNKTPEVILDLKD